MFFSFECTILFAFVQIAIMWFVFKHTSHKSNKPWMIPSRDFLRSVPMVTFSITLLFLILINILFAFLCLIFVNGTAEYAADNGFTIMGFDMIKTVGVFMCISLVACHVVVAAYLAVINEKRELTWEDVSAVYTSIVAVLLFFVVCVGVGAIREGSPKNTEVDDTVDSHFLMDMYRCMTVKK